jgi:ABC-type uncharacterized transport system involved in gliding motility auxiliary subunit
MAMISQRISVSLGIIGAALGVAGLVLYGKAPEQTIAIVAMEAAAVVLLAIFLIAHFELFKEFSRRRSVRLGFNSMLIVVLFAGILGIINFLAARHTVRWDFSETKRFTLAPQSARALRELSRDIKATVFTSDQGPARAAYQDLFDSYKARTPKLTVEFVDPEKKPGLARRYGITRLDTAVLESGKQETRITVPTEQELTNALLRVSQDERKNVYFLTGHGEHPLEESEKAGYSFLKETLERQGYTVRSLSLYETKTVPPDATVLVLGGPQRSVSSEEQRLIADYVKGGGRLVVLLDPASRAGIEGLLANWGLQSDNRVVMDTQTILGGDLTMPVVNSYGTHEITQDLGATFTIFPHVRPIAFQDSKRMDWDFHPLAKSSLRSWAQAGGDLQVREYDPKLDVRGPVVLAGVVANRKEPSEKTRRPAVVLIGDSDFASNAYLDFAGNSDFILHILAWLAEERGLVTIAPKNTAFSSFLLTTAQSNTLFSLQVLAVPGFILAAGFAVWQHRRRL